MSKYEISLLTEVFSFLFVTIDLYGKERLSRTNRRMIQFTDGVKRRIDRFSNMQLETSFKNRFMYTIYLLAFLAYALMFASTLYHDYETLGNLEILPVLRNFLLFSLFGFPISLLLILLSVAIAMGSLIFLSGLSEMLLRLTIYLLSKINFEGLLLATGSLLFLLSKYLEW